MSTRLTVFGKTISEGETATVFFDERGRIIDDGSKAVAELVFSIDEDREPVCHVTRGLHFVDDEPDPVIYMGGLLDAHYRWFEGQAVVSKRFATADWGDHYIFTIRNNAGTDDDRELHRLFVESGETVFDD